VTATVASPFARVPRFARFLLCGGIAAAGNWSSRFLWSLALPFGAAVIAAYATGMAIAFTLFRAFVFEPSENSLSVQARNFVLVNLVGMAATWALAQLLVLQLFPAIGMTLYPQAIGHAIAILAPVATSWFGHRMLTFR
jgi:putative flippase GtrA